MQSICILDWQLTRYCSPVLDLHYNIFTATDKALRDQYYEKLLQTYYSSLSETVRKLGSDPGKLFTYENLKTELKKFGEFALLCGPIILQIAVANATDIRDLDEYSNEIEENNEIELITKFDEETQAIYSKLINDLVADLLDYEYIHYK